MRPCGSQNSSTAELCATVWCSSAVRRPSASGAEGDAVDRRRPAAHHAEHLVPRQLEPHRPADEPRRHHRDHHARPPAPPLGPEAAAEEAREHADGIGRQAERAREHVAAGLHALQGRVEREPVVLPRGQRHVGLDRIVVLHRRGVDRIQPDLGVGPARGRDRRARSRAARRARRPARRGRARPAAGRSRSAGTRNEPRRGPRPAERAASVSAITAAIGWPP